MIRIFEKDDNDEVHEGASPDPLGAEHSQGRVQETAKVPSECHWGRREREKRKVTNAWVS